MSDQPLRLVGSHWDRKPLGRKQLSFQPDGRPVLFGMLTRYNKKTVTVITEAGEHWTVSPHLLRKVNDVSKTSPPAEQSNLILEHAR